MTNNRFLLDYDDDEDEFVQWIEVEDKEYFNCGCCDDCVCDDNVECSNCGCGCNGDEFEDEYEYEEDEEDDTTDNFSVKIIKSETNEKLVRITLQLNVMLDDKKSERINIDLDINSKTYLKIAEELSKII